MYKVPKYTQTTIQFNESYEGESIEDKVHRIVNNKEPIRDGAPIIYTERSEGVQPQFDIRTDRFELAVEAMDKVTQSHIAKRKSAENQRKEIGKEMEQGMKAENGGTEPIQATSN